jgi:hypothetical protein
MAILTPDGGQSSVVLNGAATSFLVNKIILEMPAAPDTLVASKLDDTLREFYTNSGAWREVIGPYNLVANREDVWVNPVDQFSQAQYVLDVWIYPSTPGGNQQQRLGVSNTKLYGVTPAPYPLWYWMETPDHMHLYPSPPTNLGQVLYMLAIMLPLTNTTRLPNMAITHHQDALIWGTLARLMMMPKKPWTDVDAAREYGKMYKRETLRWRDVANRSYSKSTPPWKFPGFAGRNNHGTSVWGVRG